MLCYRRALRPPEFARGPALAVKAAKEPVLSDPSILDRIQSDLAPAMKARDADTLSTLRMLKAALMEAKTRKPKDAVLSSDE